MKLSLDSSFCEGRLIGASHTRPDQMALLCTTLATKSDYQKHHQEYLNYIITPRKHTWHMPFSFMWGPQTSIYITNSVTGPTGRVKVIHFFSRVNTGPTTGYFNINN